MEDETDEARHGRLKKRDDIIRPKRSVYSSAPYMHEFTMWPRGRARRPL